jgi:hypothetical protein
MEMVNSLAYYDTETITAVKTFTVQTPGGFVSRKSFQASRLTISNILR